MARKNRITEAGYYHVINRGIERRNIFLEANDYNKFLDILFKVKKEYNISVHCYCLMTNHYHLLLQTKEQNISNAIKQLNGNYSIYFNKKYKRNGHYGKEDSHLFFYMMKFIFGLLQNI